MQMLATKATGTIRLDENFQRPFIWTKERIFTQGEGYADVFMVQTEYGNVTAEDLESLQAALLEHMRELNYLHFSIGDKLWQLDDVLVVVVDKDPNRGLKVVELGGQPAESVNWNWADPAKCVRF